MNKKVVLVVMDGVGISDKEYGNAVAAAYKPTLDSLMASYPWTKIKAHGTAVGLPTDDDMGNSEVGHNALGCGQVYSQGAKLVNESIESGSMYTSDIWKKLVSNCKENNSTFHFLGLLSDGNVHSHIKHLLSMIARAKQDGVKKCRIHILLDGRDVPATSGMTYIKELEDKLAELNDADFDGKIASGGGRMKITMDRYEANWDMVKLGWETHVLGQGRQFASAAEAYETLRTETGAIDQDLPPFVIAENGKPVGTVEDGDSVVFFNFRGDRSIEISRAFTEGADFDKFDRVRVPKTLYAGMLQYDGDLKIPENFLVAPPAIKNTLTEALVKAGIKEYAVSETQKYGHVTYFWNGNRSEKFSEELEDYDEVDSDTVPFEQRPWMKAAEVTDKLIEAIYSGKYGFIRCNYPNGDMVGHTGIYEAIEKAVVAIDNCVKDTVEAAKANGYEVIIIADHGNADHALNEDGTPNTAHSLNPVPFVYVTENKAAKVENGVLADVAPSILHILGMPQPADMTGKDLIK